MLNTNNDWNIIGLVLSIDCFLYCSSCLLSKNMFNMIIKHAMQEPIEILGGHSLENRLKATKPCIKLLADLSIEFSKANQFSLVINAFSNKIRCRVVGGSRITPGTAEAIISLMIVVMIGIHNKATGMFPSCVPSSIDQ